MQGPHLCQHLIGEDAPAIEFVCYMIARRSQISSFSLVCFFRLSDRMHSGNVIARILPIMENTVWVKSHHSSVI